MGHGKYALSETGRAAPTIEFELLDFHTHSFLSDGILSPIELIHRAKVAGYRGIAITDHVGFGTLERVLKEVSKECRLAERYWDIRAFAGVEITHAPAAIEDASSHGEAGDAADS